MHQHQRRQRSDRPSPTRDDARGQGRDLAFTKLDDIAVSPASDFQVDSFTPAELKQLRAERARWLAGGVDAGLAVFAGAADGLRHMRKGATFSVEERVREVASDYVLDFFREAGEAALEAAELPVALPVKVAEHLAGASAERAEAEREAKKEASADRLLARGERQLKNMIDAAMAQASAQTDEEVAAWAMAREPGQPMVTHAKIEAAIAACLAVVAEIEREASPACDQPAMAQAALKSIPREAARLAAEHDLGDVPGKKEE